MFMPALAEPAIANAITPALSARKAMVSLTSSSIAELSAVCSPIRDQQIFEDRKNVNDQRLKDIFGFGSRRRQRPGSRLMAWYRVTKAC